MRRGVEQRLIHGLSYNLGSGLFFPQRHVIVPLIPLLFPLLVLLLSLLLLLPPVHFVPHSVPFVPHSVPLVAADLPPLLGPLRFLLSDLFLQVLALIGLVVCSNILTLTRFSPDVILYHRCNQILFP